MDPGLLALVALLAFVVLMLPTVWSYALWLRPHVFLRSGRWADARRAAELLEASWLRVFDATRGTAAYVRALTLHLEGDFEGSLGALVKVREVPTLRQAALLVEAGNLVLAGVDPTRAQAAAREACALHAHHPEDALLLVHAELAAGHAEAAAAAFARVPATRPRRAPWPAINEPVFHYLRALYLVKTDTGDPRLDLEAAVHGKVTSVYVTRARALLEASAARPEPEEAPSSLAPQVLDE